MLLHQKPELFRILDMSVNSANVGTSVTHDEGKRNRIYLSRSWNASITPAQISSSLSNPLSSNYTSVCQYPSFTPSKAVCSEGMWSYQGHLGRLGCGDESSECIKKRINKCQLESQWNSLDQTQLPLQIRGLC